MRDLCDLEDRPRATSDEVDDQKDQCDDEQDIGDLRGNGSNARYTKGTGDEANDEKHQSVIQHLRTSGGSGSMRHADSRY